MISTKVIFASAVVIFPLPQKLNSNLGVYSVSGGIEQTATLGKKATFAKGVVGSFQPLNIGNKRG